MNILVHVIVFLVSLGLFGGIGMMGYSQIKEVVEEPTSDGMVIGMIMVGCTMSLVLMAVCMVGLLWSIGVI
jgi:hypothetical protein